MTDLSSEVELSIGRLRSQALLRNVAVALLASLALVVSAGWAFSTDIAAVPVLAAAIAAVAAGGLAGAALTPSLRITARRLEAKRNLTERLSTAIEARGRSDAVARALVTDAMASTRALRASDALPHAGPAAIGLAALAVVALVVMVLLSWQPAEPPSSADPGPIAADAASMSNEQLSLLAERLAADADAQRNSYLAAVSQAVSNLARQNLPPADLAAQLEELISQARQAYGDSPPAWLPSEGQDLADLGNRLQGLAEQDAAAAAELAERISQGLSTEAISARDMYAADEGLEERAKIADELAAQAAAAQEAEGLREGGAPQAAPSSLPQPMGDEPLVSIGAAPAGASPESGKGESNAAGLGTEDLAADPGYNPDALAPAEDVLLAADDAEAGVSETLQVAPEVGAITVSSGTVTYREWQRQREVALMREPVGSDAADVIASYFDPGVLAE